MSNSGKPTIALDTGFHFDQVDPAATPVDASILTLNPALAAVLINPPATILAGETVNLSSPLGDLVGFTNQANPTDSIVFEGTGFNSIFRPQSPNSTTPLPFPVPGSDNILELNLTTETLTFAAPLGNVPNRGFGVQGDLFLNGVPYVQSVNDITSGTATGIHFEPGMWLAIPPTTEPPVNQTIYTRMASIPHGVTINAQGISLGRKTGTPPIAPVNMNPFFIGQAQNPPNLPFFPNQTAATQKTARIPQDLTAFITAGTITQAILDDPNTVLRQQLVGQNVQSFVTLIITTDCAGKLPTPPPNPTLPPAPPVTLPPAFGGGTDEIALLLGDSNTPPLTANAHAFKMTAVFWIETVLETLVVPPCKANGLPITIQAAPRPGSSLRPTFTLTPPNDILVNKTIIVPYIQIQYSQTVFLNFGPLTWPHVSVATLIPSAPIPVCPTASIWY